VYPLEVLMRLLDERPELLPGVRPGHIIGNADELRNGKRVLAGLPLQIPVPPDCRLKSFALLGGGRPGYEFFPTPGDETRYTFQVDTPGSWTFAVLAAPLQQLGRIQRETQEALLEVFTVEVWAMGKKGHPLSADEWRIQQETEAELAGFADDNGDDDDDDDSDANQADQHVAGGDVAPRTVGLIAMQVRVALEQIQRDVVADDAPAAATTYSWVCELRKPGSDVDSEPLLRVVVDKATAFDAAWHRAREAIATKQKEFEPARQPLTQDDLTAALQRARVR
jgi:hypothetical protein